MPKKALARVLFAQAAMKVIATCRPSREAWFEVCPFSRGADSQPDGHWPLHVRTGAAPAWTCADGKRALLPQRALGH